MFGRHLEVRVKDVLVPTAILLLLLGSPRVAQCADSTHVERVDPASVAQAESTAIVPRATVSDAGDKPNKGKLELFVASAKKKQLIDALTNHFINKSWSIAQSSEYQMTYETDAKGAAGFMSGVFFGSQTQPVYRFTATFVEGEFGAKALCLLELVSNPGSNRPTRTEMMSGKSRQQIRDMLQQVGDKLARDLATQH